MHGARERRPNDRAAAWGFALRPWPARVCPALAWTVPVWPLVVAGLLLARAAAPAANRHLPVLVVDPGHGWSPAERSYTGAYNARAGLYEDTFNLDIGLRLAAVLRARGAEVYLTRTGDQEPPDYNGDGEQTNADRAYLALHLRHFYPQASRPRADAYISIHLNASRDSRKRGTTVVYSQAGSAARYVGTSALLSMAIHQRMVTVLPESAPPFAVNGLYMDRLALPHAIVEVVFITNWADLRWIQETAHRQQAAELIADGVLEWWFTYGQWEQL